MAKRLDDTQIGAIETLAYQTTEAMRDAVTLLNRTACEELSEPESVARSCIALAREASNFALHLLMRAQFQKQRREVERLQAEQQ